MTENTFHLSEFNPVTKLYELNKEYKERIADFERQLAEVTAHRDRLMKLF